MTTEEIEAAKTANTTNTSKTNTNKNIATANSIVSETAEAKETAKVEVLNGTASTTKFEEAVAKLKEAGFNVKSTGKSNETSQTVIKNKKYAKDTILEEIKTTLGVGYISNSAASTSKVDISVIIGNDYK